MNNTGFKCGWDFSRLKGGITDETSEEGQATEMVVSGYLEKSGRNHMPQKKQSGAVVKTEAFGVREKAWFYTLF